MGLKLTMNRTAKTIQNLHEKILKNTKARHIEKEVDDSGEVCANVCRILAGIDLSLKDGKSSGHMETSPSFIHDNNNVKTNEGAEMKLPKLELE